MRPARRHSTSGRARLQPADLKLSKARAYQLVRRAVLLASLSLAVVTPLWRLGNIERESAGIAAQGTRIAIGDRLPDVAAPILGAPWTVRVFGVEFMDPLAAIGLAVAGGFPLGAWLGVLLPLVLVAALGRFFCGWLCPYVPLLALSNSVRALLARLGLPPPDVRLPKQAGFMLLAIVLISAAVGGTQLGALVYPPSLLGRELFRYIFYGTCGAGTLLILAVFLFDTFVSRAGFCRSLCPGGALFRILGAASPITVKRLASDCTACTACDVVCNLGQKPMSDRIDSGCERCGKCVSVCPTGALHFGIEPTAKSSSFAPQEEMR